MPGSVKEWITGLIKSESTAPHWLPYPQPADGGPGSALVKDADYFRVRVHRIHLTYDREWFQTYAPVLVVATQFTYDGQEITQPAVVGPSVIEQLGVATPANPVIVGSIAAGPHPLADSTLKVTVALQRVARGEVANAFLNVVEGTAKALDLVAGVVPFTDLARVVIDGVTALTGGDRPLMARQDTFTPVRTSYYAMVAPAAGVDPQSLYLVDDDLVHQAADGEWKKFRAADFVLYSIDRVPMSDVSWTKLPLGRQWQTVLDDAMKANTPEGNQSMKTSLAALIRMAWRSPDLTGPHRDELEQYWIRTAVERRTAAQGIADLGGERIAPDDERRRALAVLDL